MCLQDKLAPSEQLGDLLRQAGDNEAALSCYQKANVPHKVIEGLAAKGDFTELSKYSSSQARPSVGPPLRLHRLSLSLCMSQQWLPDGAVCIHCLYWPMLHSAHVGQAEVLILRALGYLCNVGVELVLRSIAILSCSMILFVDSDIQSVTSSSRRSISHCYTSSLPRVHVVH